MKPGPEKGDVVPSTSGAFACCDRYAALTNATVSPAVARRRLLKAAVSRQADADRLRADADPLRADEYRGQEADFADSAQLPRTVCGTVQDVSPHVLVIARDDVEQRFTLTPDARAWHGHHTEPAALRQGDNVVVRLRPGRSQVADRVWANIGRVTGVISQRSGSDLVVDEGPTSEPQLVSLRASSIERIQVRFPTLEPGYLIDIIGLRLGAGTQLLGVIPGTSQPTYPAHRLPAAPLPSGHMPGSVSGSATWHEPRAEPPGVLGVKYPALDPETGCAEEAQAGVHQRYTRMPYLSIGSVLRVRNDCTGSECLVPVTGCASIAGLFNDRCLTCDTSPRGRVADLTLASFIALGGELEHACFNASITWGDAP